MTTGQKIRVLVVEGSDAARMNLGQILRSDPKIEVVGIVMDGPSALCLMAESAPDVVLMDLDMPRREGYLTTRQIMETCPVPVIVSADSSVEAIASLHLTEIGAVAGVQKPYDRVRPGFDAIAAQLLLTVKLMAEIKVVRRRPRRASDAAVREPAAEREARPRSNARMIGIGASTGGPVVLQSILGGLPDAFPLPLLVVQHIAPGFLPNMVNWLRQTTALDVRIGADGQVPLPGAVYLAPDDCHMGLRADGRIGLSYAAPEFGLRPSVAHLFRSLADHAGACAVGVLLTGMGKDGAAELKRMKDRGSLTIVQDRQTSAVFGMPGTAIDLGAAACVLPADGIAPALVALVGQQSSSEEGNL